MVFYNLIFRGGGDSPGKGVMLVRSTAEHFFEWFWNQEGYHLPGGRLLLWGPKNNTTFFLREVTARQVGGYQSVPKPLEKMFRGRVHEHNAFSGGDFYFPESPLNIRL